MKVYCCRLCADPCIAPYSRLNIPEGCIYCEGSDTEWEVGEMTEDVVMALFRAEQ